MYAFVLYEYNAWRIDNGMVSAAIEQSTQTTLV